jgi:hypothetical protein
MFCLLCVSFLLYTNASKVGNYYILDKYYVCLGFLLSICSLQMICNYVPGSLTIGLLLNRVDAL